MKKEQINNLLGSRRLFLFQKCMMILIGLIGGLSASGQKVPVQAQKNPVDLNKRHSKGENPLFEKALKAYGLSDFKTVSELGKISVLSESQKPEHLKYVYSILAEANVMIGNNDLAFSYLKNAIDLGYGKHTEFASLEFAPKLQALHKDPRWKLIIRLGKRNFVAYAKSNGDNPEVQLLYEQDQAERRVLPELAKNKPEQAKALNLQLLENDKLRRDEMKKYIDDKKVISANDYYAAAFIFHHSPNLKDIKFARNLAQSGYDLAKDRKEKCNLAFILTRNIDRILWFQGKPQIYGTHFRPENLPLESMVEIMRTPPDKLSNKLFSTPFSKKTTKEPFDRTKVYVAERKNMCLPPLDQY